MKVKTLVENVPGTLNRRYYCELVEGDTVIVKREGDDMSDAASRAISALRYLADDAERVLKEMGILPKKG